MHVCIYILDLSYLSDTSNFLASMRLITGMVLGCCARYVLNKDTDPNTDSSAMSVHAVSLLKAAETVCVTNSWGLPSSICEQSQLNQWSKLDLTLKEQNIIGINAT